MGVESVTPVELQRLLLSGEQPLTLLDVREDWEVALCRIEGARTIPMARIPAALGELDRSATTVVLCHHGMRSLQVAAFLARQGFERVLNLHGGIDAWACEVDPGMARY